MAEYIEIVELLSGEKLIGLHETSNNTHIVMRDVFAIIPDQRQQGNFIFASWPMFRDESQDIVEISKHSIVIEYVPTKQISDHYNRATAKKSGIIIPPGIISA